MKPYRLAEVKFNGGEGALLCNKCSIIIAYGYDHEDKEHFCERCTKRNTAMSEKVYIEIDASPWMDDRGVTTSVFMGDACEPCYENLYTYEELIDRALYANTIHGVLTNKHGHDNIEVAEAFVVALEQAAKYAREKFDSLVEGEDGN